MTTPNLELTELVAAQAQPHIPINSALRRLDAAVQLSVLGVENDPPASSPSPPDGDRYIIGQAPTDVWVGHAGDLAFWSAGDWAYVTPQLGWIAYDIEDSEYKMFIGGSPAAWARMSLGGGAASSPSQFRLFEDFLHAPSTTPYDGWDSITGVSAVSPIGADDAVGIWSLPTGTNINGAVSIYHSNVGATTHVCPDCGPIRIRVRIKAMAVENALASPSVLWIGLLSSAIASPAYAITIEISNNIDDEPSFRGFSRAATADLDATAYGGTAIVSGGWYTVELIIAAGVAEAFVDGVSIGEFSVSPAEGYMLAVHHKKLGVGADSRIYNIDYFEFTQDLART